MKFFSLSLFSRNECEIEMTGNQENFSLSLFSRSESEIKMTQDRDREVKFQNNSRESRLSQVTDMC